MVWKESVRIDLLEAKGADWGMTDKKIQEDYVVTMSSRLMNMQAHLIHAGHSKKKIVWYDELTKTNETLTKTNVTDEPTKIDQDTPIEDGLQHKIFKNIKTKQYKQTNKQTKKQTNKQTNNKKKRGQGLQQRIASVLEEAQRMQTWTCRLCRDWQSRSWSSDRCV